MTTYTINGYYVYASVNLTTFTGTQEIKSVEITISAPNDIIARFDEKSLKNQVYFYDSTSNKKADFEITGYTTHITSSELQSSSYVIVDTRYSQFFTGVSMQDNNIFAYEKVGLNATNSEIEYVFIPLDGSALPTSYDARDQHAAELIDFILAIPDNPSFASLAFPNFGETFDLADAPTVEVSGREPEPLIDGQGTEDADLITTEDANDEIDGLGGDDTIAARGGNDKIYGGDGDDRISASDGDDTVSGGDGNDRIGGGYGNDHISGNAGNDTIGSGRGDDYVDAGAGDDMVSGSFGNDVIHGASGHDRLAGAVGDDSIDGGNGNDNIGGGYGSDTITGNMGDDTVGAGQQDDSVNGGGGNDVLNGNNGHDTLNGGDGNDTLNGGDHNDVLTGGADADVFYFRVYRDGDVDRITDFEIGEDKIQLRGNFDALEISDMGNDLLIEKNGHQIIVEGVESLGEDDFIFM